MEIDMGCIREDADDDDMVPVVKDPFPDASSPGSRRQLVVLMVIVSSGLSSASGARLRIAFLGCGYDWGRYETIQRKVEKESLCPASAPPLC